MPVVEPPAGVDAPPGVRWGFTGRTGAPDGALTLGEGAPAAHWEAVAAALGCRAADVVLLRQVHGDRVVHSTQATGPRGVLADADAVWTDRPGLVLAVRVADCVPILLAGPRGVAAVHAGWRGVASGIVGRAVDALAAGTGVAPREIDAAVGPCLGQDAFEVGPEVVAAWAGAVPDVASVARPGRADRVHLDLRGAVSQQLVAAGVGAVGHLDACTSGPAWFSYRVDGPHTGRQAGVIAWAG